MTPSDHLTESEGEAAFCRISSRSFESSLVTASLLAWIGVAICYLLIQSHGVGGSLFCRSHTGCEVILSSRYSAIAGIPLAWFGLGFYVSVLALFLTTYGTGCGVLPVLLMEVAKWLTVAGVSFSASLMLIQFFILRGFCPLCTSSAIVAVGLFVLAARCRRLVEEGSFQGSQRGAIALACFALVSGAVMAVSSNAYRSRLQEVLARPVLIDLSKAQVSGPRDAKVQLVIFSDFQCPLCARVAPVLKRIREEFPNDVMVAYRYFPVEGHDRAIPAAIAAECAGEQGVFWEFHDHLFSDPANLTEARFLSIAESLGLDRERFRGCLSSDKARQVVETSYKDAEQMGLPGVPLIFLNGRMIDGALDHDRLMKEIKQRLSRDVQPQQSPSGAAQ